MAKRLLAEKCGFRHSRYFRRVILQSSEARRVGVLGEIDSSKPLLL
jgi:hypothetical protein